MAPVELPVNFHPTLGLCLFFLGIIVALVIHERNDTLRDIPGPFLARWTPLWLFYHARLGRRFKAVHEAHQVNFNS